MPSVELDNEEWQKVLAIIAQAPWGVANPLLMKIGEQLKSQSLGNNRQVPENATEFTVKQ